MRNLELRRVNPLSVYTCSGCHLDYRTDGNSYYDASDGLMVCNDCAEGMGLKNPPIYTVENVHYVGVSDKRDIVVFDGAEEVRISQRSILNHKKLVGILQATQYLINSDNTALSVDSFFAKKLSTVLEEENDEAV